jgi:sugar lactone lactonase YvrE
LSRNLSRRELIVRGALGGAALTLPLPDALASVRRHRRRPSIHCLSPAYRFKPAGVLSDAAFAAFAPNGQRIAAATPRGIEVYNRADRSRLAVTPPGFTITGNAWHPSGNVLVASGPAPDGSGPYLHAVTGAGLTRLLPDHPGQARAGCFSPDGKKVAFTYVNGFVHQLCMADWTGSALASPLNLFPVDPQSDPYLDRVMSSLAWYETWGFSADGQRLYFASDRTAGMLNVSVHYVNLAKGKRHRVTYDEGVTEGAVLAPDGNILYTANTRAREPAFLTMVSGPAVPPFLGFVAEPTLHEQLSAKHLAPIGNGDIIAMDSAYGLRGRMVGNRRALAKRVGAAVGGGLYRVIACSMSPDGTDLAVGMLSPAGSSVVLLHRQPANVPPGLPAGATPSPPGAVPLSSAPLPPVDRVMASQRNGKVTLHLRGDLAAGEFHVEFDNFSPDGVVVFAGPVEFLTAGGGFRHTADVRRVGLESQEDVNVFYSAEMQVDWSESGLAGQPTPPATGGKIASLSRSGDCAAQWDGTTFAPQDGWNAGNRGPRPVPGAERCRRARRS